MWISRYKWERLVERVEKLENAPKPFLYIWDGWRHHPLLASDAVQIIADKLGVTFKRHAATHETWVLIDKNAADPK